MLHLFWRIFLTDVVILFLLGLVSVNMDPTSYGTMIINIIMAVGLVLIPILVLGGIWGL